MSTRFLIHTPTWMRECVSVFELWDMLWARFHGIFFRGRRCSPNDELRTKGMRSRSFGNWLLVCVNTATIIWVSWVSWGSDTFLPSLLGGYFLSTYTITWFNYIRMSPPPKKKKIEPIDSSWWCHDIRVWWTRARRPGKRGVGIFPENHPYTLFGRKTWLNPFFFGGTSSCSLIRSFTF